MPTIMPVIQLTRRGFTCKFLLTGESKLSGEPTLTDKAGLLAVLTAVANVQRMRVVAELTGGRVHVSELARRLGMSRPLLYMHLDRLEKAGLVTGQLELSEDGKAMKYYALAPFDFRITAETITEAVQQAADEADDGSPDQ
jgi:DNA-binding transcriptional ArsR family regulator